MRRLGAVVVLAMMFVGLTSLALAMHRYPGGTELDRHTIGHSFWFNLLCDLTGDRALDGAANPGRGFGRAAMMAFSLGMGAFWLILPAEFPGHRGLALAVRVGGAVSVLGFLAVPVADGPWHAIAVFAAAVPGVLAAVTGLVATLRFVRHTPLLVAATGSIAATTLDALLYAQRVMNEYRSCPPALPVLQRLTLLFVLAWAALTALRALRPPSLVPSPRTA